MGVERDKAMAKGDTDRWRQHAAIYDPVFVFPQGSHRAWNRGSLSF